MYWAQIRVNQQDRQLTISGERRRKAAGNGNAERDEDAEPTSRQKTRESRFGKFKRQFKLPEDADLDAVSARCVLDFLASRFSCVLLCSSLPASLFSTAACETSLGAAAAR